DGDHHQHFDECKGTTIPSVRGHDIPVTTWTASGMSRIIAKASRYRKAGRGTTGGWSMSPTVSPARADEFALALQLIFHERPAAAALRALDEGALDPSGLLVVRDEAGVAAAALAAMLPDGGAVVWPPRIRPRAADVTGLLAEHAVGWLREHG